MHQPLRSSTFSRRRFLRAAAVGIALPCLETSRRVARGGEQDRPSLVAAISRQVLWEGRRGGDIPTWFHPRACMVPGDGGSTALMSLQRISGSDVFWPVHWTASTDLGRTWSEPRPIPGLDRHPYGEDMEEGVCDVVPEYHAKTDTVLAMGHNVYYRRGVLAQPQGPRFPVYVVRDAGGRWSKPKRLRWDDPRGSAIYTCGCAQRIMLPDGSVLVPISFGPKGRRDRAVGSVLCSFDGETVAIQKVSNELRNTAGRGLLEPSLAVVGGRYFTTIRAEDGRGYVTSSATGLDWAEPQPWSWDDGRPLSMSTTQQHWLVHGDALFLVYTRKAEHNVNVFRWRAPLYLAQVDRSTLRLVRDTEQVVLPLIGDGVNDPNHVARMGNFHVTNASPGESWVTVGECLPHDGWRGNTLLARIRWRRPKT